MCSTARPGFALAEPFSLTAFFISLALSAASYAVQRIFGPKPPKQVRGQMSGELFIQNAEEGNPIPEIYGGAPSQTVRSATWANLTRAAVNDDGDLQNDNSGSDNCFTDASGTGDSGAWTVETITGGDWEISWKFAKDGGGDAGRSFVGLTNGSFTVDFTQWDYCIHLSTEANTSGTPHPAGSVFIYQGSPPNLAFLDGVWAEGDTFRIACESGVVRYYHKSTLIYTSAVAPSYPLRVVASMACHDSIIQDLVISTPSVDNKGGIKTAGTVIWCKAPRKVVTKEKKGGKGAPKQTVETITYYTDLAILFGRGRLRLKKLWANADLIVDMDAGIGLSTGLIDPGSVDTTTYSQGAPPTGSVIGLITWAQRQDGSISGTVGAGGGASMRWYEGNFDQLPDSVIEGDVGAGNAPAYRGSAYLVIENFDISKYGGVPTFLATVENVDYLDLQDIADHLCERVGIEPQDKDFDGFDGQSVRGLVVQQPQAPRATLEIAAIPYQAQFFEAVDGLLTGSYLGGSSVVTIDEDYLGMVEGDQISTNGQMGERRQIALVDEIQIPRQVTITAFNPYKDHETTAQSAYRMTGFAEGIDAQTLPMALSPDETRQAAERILYQRHIERESNVIKLPWRYCWLNPCDVIEIEEDGDSDRVRLTQISGAVPGLLEFQAAKDELDIYSQSISGDSGEGYESPTVSAPATSVAFLMDTVTLRDADDKAGYYAAVAPSTSGSWPGAVLYRDRGAGFEVVERFLAAAVAGTISGVLADADPAVWDETNSITVDLYGTTETLESVTEAQVLAGANAAMVGDEVIQFQNAVQVGGYDNRWTLSRLLRGRRGTDFGCSTHASGERFVLLDGAVLFIENDLSERGVARDFKAVTGGFSLTDTAATSFTWDAGTLLPLSVVNVAGTWDGSNNLTIEWQRRTRVGSAAWETGGTAPIGEESLEFEIDVIVASVAVRTITATSETASYTAAEQTADGITPGNPVTVKIYQMSATVGRGRVREATV